MTIYCTISQQSPTTTQLHCNTVATCYRLPLASRSLGGVAMVKAGPEGATPPPEKRLFTSLMLLLVSYSGTSYVFHDASIAVWVLGMWGGHCCPPSLLCFVCFFCWWVDKRAPLAADSQPLLCLKPYSSWISITWGSDY